MLLKVYKNQVQLVDDNDTVLAHLDFANEDGVYRIGDVAKNTQISPKVENKMMSLALNKIRKNGGLVVPTSTYSKEWFNKHPEDRDLVAAVESVAQETASIPQETEIQLVKQEPSNNPLQNLNTEEIKKKGAKGALKILSRLMQVICALCMFGSAVLFVMNALNYTEFVRVMITSQGQDHKIFLGGMAAFVVFCVIEGIWTLTTKKMKAGEEEYRVDTGHGLIGFIIVALSYPITLYVAGMHGESGAWQWVQYFITPMRYIPLVAVIGLLLCILRKLINR